MFVNFHHSALWSHQGSVRSCNTAEDLSLSIEESFHAVSTRETIAWVGTADRAVGCSVGRRFHT